MAESASHRITHYKEVAALGIVSKTNNVCNSFTQQRSVATISMERFQSIQTQGHQLLVDAERR